MAGDDARHARQLQGQNNYSRKLAPLEPPKPSKTHRRTKPTQTLPSRARSPRPSGAKKLQDVGAATDLHVGIRGTLAEETGVHRQEVVGTPNLVVERF